MCSYCKGVGYTHIVQSSFYVVQPCSSCYDEQAVKKRLKREMAELEAKLEAAELYHEQQKLEVVS